MTGRKIGNRAIWLTALSATLSGCFLWTSAGQGDELEGQARDHSQRLAQLEEVTIAERRVLQQAKTKVIELETVLEQATQVVTRNSADLGLEVEQLRAQIGTLEGQVAELRNQVQTERRAREEERETNARQIKLLAQKVGLDVELSPSEIPNGEDAHLAAARRAFESRDYSRARALYQHFVTRHGRSEHVDNAHFSIGRTYMEQDRPASALGSFRTVITEHNTGDMVDDTLFAMSEAFYSLNACTDARNALNALIRAHGRSPLITRARRRLREYTNAPRGYCRS